MQKKTIITTIMSPSYQLSMSNLHKSRAFYFFATTNVNNNETATNATENCLTYINLVYSHNNHMRLILLLFSFYRTTEWSTDGQSMETHKLESGRTGAHS